MIKKITIAIDAMGGENAPTKNLQGLDLFIKKNKSNNDFQINLYGNKEIIDKEILKLNISKEFLNIL